MRVKLLIMAEVKVPEGCDEPLLEAHEALDRFREATLPSQNYGITLSCINPREMSEDLALHGKEIVREGRR